MRATVLLLAFATGLAVPPAVACARQVAPAQDTAGAAPAATAGARRLHPPPTELLDVVKVVDGDTIHVQRKGELEKLRLLSVDTEERLSGRPGSSPTKPETVFGEECALWAQEFFAQQAEDDGPSRVGLLFPDGDEQRDVYGRLLCHVVLPDGTDFNLLLVELGKSPYFNKYGNSRICDGAFRAAQERARVEQLGVWNPATNTPKTAGAPAAMRPYDRLLPWWEARAKAIDEFRAKHAEEPERYVSAERPEQLEAAADSGEVAVFGQVFRFYDETDGSRTVLMRGDPERALRVRIPADQRDAHAALDLDATLGEFQPNFLWVRGTITRGARGLEMKSAGPGRWRRAGAE